MHLDIGIFELLHGVKKYEPKSWNRTKYKKILYISFFYLKKSGSNKNTIFILIIRKPK